MELILLSITIVCLAALVYARLLATGESCRWERDADKRTRFKTECGNSSRGMERGTHCMGCDRKIKIVEQRL